MKISHGVEFWNRNLKSEDRFPTRDNSSTLRRLINRGEGKKFSGSTVSKTKSGDAFERQRNPELVREFVSIPSSPPGGPASDGNYARVTRRQSHYCGTSDIFIGEGDESRHVDSAIGRYFIGPGNILFYSSRFFPTRERKRTTNLDRYEFERSILSKAASL